MSEHHTCLIYLFPQARRIGAVRRVIDRYQNLTVAQANHKYNQTTAALRSHLNEIGFAPAQVEQAVVHFHDACSLEYHKRGLTIANLEKVEA